MAKDGAIHTRTPIKAGEQLKVTSDDSGLFINGRAIGETGVILIANGTGVMSVQKLFLPDGK